MYRKSFIIYISLILITLLTNIIVVLFTGFNSTFFYLLTSSLYLIFPFISLFYILFLNIKKIEYKVRKYDELSLITYVICGSVLLFIYSNLAEYLDLWVWYVVSLAIFLAASITLAILEFKFGKIKESKFMVNK